jgi:hypothetical protein
MNDIMRNRFRSNVESSWENEFENQRKDSYEAGIIYEDNSGTEFWSTIGLVSTFRFYALGNDYNKALHIIDNEKKMINAKNAELFKLGFDGVFEKFKMGINNEPFLTYIVNTKEVVISNWSIFNDRFLDSIENNIKDYFKIGSHLDLLVKTQEGKVIINKEAVKRKHVIIIWGALLHHDYFYTLCKHIISYGALSVTGLFLTRSVPNKSYY